MNVSQTAGLIAALLFSSQAAMAEQKQGCPAFAPASPAPITITTENVDLFGEGQLAFSPDRKAYAVEPTTAGEELSATVRLRVDASGNPVSCDVGQSALSQAANTGCAQLLRSARFRLHPDVAPFHSGFIDVAFIFRIVASGLQVTAQECPGYANTDIVYPPDDIPAEQHLHAADGTFVVHMDSADYPVLALRYNLKSLSTVLLGIDRLGHVLSCRSLSNGSGPNTAFLDNYSCRILPKRGEFEFAPSAPTYTGLRYLVRHIHWVLASDD